MKAVDYILAWLMVAMGLLHSASMWHRPGPVTVETVWFFGAGAAVIMGGLMNVTRISAGSGFARGSAILANILLVVLIAGVTWFGPHHLPRDLHLLFFWGIAGGELALSLGRRH
jgi:hypothetical protein